VTINEQRDALAGAVARVLDSRYTLNEWEAHLVSLSLGYCTVSQVLVQARILRNNPWQKARWLAVALQETSDYLLP